MSDTLDLSRTPEPLPEPIGDVVVVASLHKVPDGYQAVTCLAAVAVEQLVAQTTDGCDADLWKDTLFKSKQDNVVVDMKLIDLKDALPAGFSPILETLDTKEAALRKRRLCLKLSPRALARTALYDIQVFSKSKILLTNYTCVGPAASAATRPHYEHQISAASTLSAMDGVPFALSDKFDDTLREMQRVNLMGITIKSLAEIEEEFQYNFSTERSVAC
ncbi:hypothetical protein CRUP_017534 [Coryphaenoides rupestris]|nr:hypothetical protein CRUP_017534 [Coryphaenoides rupestris]